MTTWVGHDAAFDKSDRGEIFYVKFGEEWMALTSDFESGDTGQRWGKTLDEARTAALEWFSEGEE